MVHVVAKVHKHTHNIIVIILNYVIFVIFKRNTAVILIIVVNLWNICKQGWPWVVKVLVKPKCTLQKTLNNITQAFNICNLRYQTISTFCRKTSK